MCASMKELGDAPVGDTITLADNPTSAPYPGFKPVKPMVLFRPVPGGTLRVREPQGGARKAPAQRRGLQLRAGDLAGAGLRLPLRFPRPAAHRDRSGTAGTRVRGQADHHGPVRHLRGGDRDRRDPDHRQPVQAAGPDQDIVHPRAVRAGSRSMYPTSMWARSWPCARKSAVFRRTWPT